MATSYSLHGKVALVAVTSRGICRGTAIDLAARGASVVVAYSASSGSAAEFIREIGTAGSKAIVLQAGWPGIKQIAGLFEKAIEQLRENRHCYF
jgi:3-oxoacyl-[acyl-carrier protein] reductase